MKKVLFVAPHPDDETLGCGGTILKHKANGDEIYWLIITNIDEATGWNKEFVIQKKIDEEDFVVYSEKWETFLKGKKKFTNDKMKEDYPWAFYFEDKEKI